MSNPQVVFYEIPDKDPTMLVRAICKLICEYYRANTNVHVLTANESELTFLDETLWSYPRNSFIPHLRASATQEKCRVTLDCTPTFEGSGSVLINHTNDIPICVEQFDIVCEFVLQQQEMKQQARSKFASYRKKYGNPSFVNISDWENRPILDL
ncbi:MAG: DNA polymerase III subunit chi [Gammaproteobacteria bacterium]|nr:DNA polymerase III subunit chi [Gammaproteobacteria bacterium]MYC24636.1 DNA polymerase III subunit chi [Gammaproteobacteria bacterium]